MEITSSVSKEKNFDVFDLIKYIMSLMVVAIHTRLFPFLLYPWLRIAVPMFYIISSFLTFSKINNDRNNKWIIIKKTIVRDLKYYLFWVVVLLPITLYFNKDMFYGGVLKVIITFLKNLLFSGMFPASWFIIALIEGLLIVAFFRIRFQTKNLYCVYLSFMLFAV